MRLSTAFDSRAGRAGRAGHRSRPARRCSGAGSAVSRVRLACLLLVFCCSPPGTPLPLPSGQPSVDAAIGIPGRACYEADCTQMRWACGLHERGVQQRAASRRTAVAVPRSPTYLKLEPIGPRHLVCQNGRESCQCSRQEGDSKTSMFPGNPSCARLHVGASRRAADPKVKGHSTGGRAQMESGHHFESKMKPTGVIVRDRPRPAPSGVDGRHYRDEHCHGCRGCSPFVRLKSSALP